MRSAKRQNAGPLGNQSGRSRRGAVLSSVAGRLFFATAFPSALLIIVLGIAAWSGARSAVMKSLNAQLSTAVSIGAARLSASRALFLLPGDEDSRTYRRLQKKLQAIEKASGSVRVLLLDEQRSVLTDAKGEFAIGSPAPRVSLDSLEIERALDGNASVSIPFVALDGRRFVSAYARLPEEENTSESKRPALVLAMEAPAETLDLVDDVALYFSLAVLLGVFFVVMLSFIVAGTITRPLRTLAHFAEGLGAGALQVPLPPQRGKDEVAVLGQTLEDMRHALVERDEEQQMMLAGIAHEIRNPLGGMELFSGLLEEGLVEADELWNEEIRVELIEHSGRVRHELVYLKGVVNDFLAYARNLPIQRSDVNISSLLNEVATLRNAEYPQVEVRIQESMLSEKEDRFEEKQTDSSLDDDTPTQERFVSDQRFPMDKRRIKEALLNLLSNAQEASGESGTVLLAAQQNERNELVFVVEDSGKGMEQKIQDRIFSPFFTTRERGSGLGLPLVKKFAKDHGGDVKVESIVGKGTRIFLFLARETGLGRVENSVEVDGRLPSQRRKTKSANGGQTSSLDVTDEDEPLLLGDD
ncbi:MAG: HAMP domain-containing histidine kinase [Deltaproteobacteria bacterium]|nr:HAMP domain-containing histidine kinase [Deltaproteobacteria bacterium]